MKYTLPLILASFAFAQAPAKTFMGLAITGDLPAPLNLTLEELAKMPRQTVHMPNPNGSMAAYEGVSLFEVLKKAGVPFGEELRGKALSNYVLAKASDGYQVIFTPGEIDPSFGNQTILIADHLDGSPLSGNQGPLRLVAPNDKAGARSVRMLEALEFVRLRK
jgi:DMSO/TMAO reductase YedYZ molybdopterin-dependent catalytic subunit